MAWAAVTFAALGAGPPWLAALLAPTAALAGLQAARSWRRQRRRAAPAVAGGGAALLVGAAALGPVAAAVAALVVVVASLAPGPAGGAGRRSADPFLTAGIALAVGAGAGAPVLLLAEGLVPALVLLSFVHAHDASAYIVGTGASSAWEGPAAAVAAVAAVTLAVAAVFVPPFRGATPWALGGLAAVLAPLGPVAGSALLGDRRARAPALRRIDSLLVLGPGWALAAALVLE